MTMRSRPAMLLFAMGFALTALPRAHGDELRRPRPLLPGVQAKGAVLLPNQWSLRPAGKQVELGDFPVNLALHPSGDWLAALHAGHGEHEIVIVDLKTQRVASRATLPQAFYGLCFSPDGRRLFASGGEFEVVHVFDFDRGYLFHHDEFAAVPFKEKFIPSGMTADAAGRMLYVAGPWGDAVAVVPIDNPRQMSRIPTGPESFPYTCLADPACKRLYVSLWNKSAVAVLDLEDRKVAENWPTERHPTEMALSPDGKVLFVACADSTKVSVLETASGKGLETISCALHPNAPPGNTPNSLCLTPDGSLLFVANADANNIAVFKVDIPGQAKPLGFIPVGMYPTSVRFDAGKRRLYVANARGVTPKANPHGPVPGRVNSHERTEYIADLYTGTLSIINLPTPEHMARYSRQAYACSPLRADQGVVAEPPADNPIPRRVGDLSPIKHVIYVIKENRTYDQVFGDVKEGNGDPNLCLFPESVTPNHHRLALEFVLLDNFYVDGEVSADGHQWSMGAYATDFVRKTWPIFYRPGHKDKITYPSEGEGDELSRPGAGYIWDRCAEAGVTYRTYGEWVGNGKSPAEPGRALAKSLEGHFDPWFRSFDMDYSDQKRADRFLAELTRFEKEGELPRLVILRLPNDHTSGAKKGKPTPTAYVADNDLALGRVVDAISHGPFWKDTAIFVIEDDAQNGPDHVDAHRTVALAISPYARRGAVDSALYSTTSIVRTIELILGLKPMSQFDAAARPMYGSFQANPDLRPYSHLVPHVDLNEKNTTTAWGAERADTLDLAREDRADEQLLNEMIWRSVRGAKSRMPPPVRSAFVFPHQKVRDADDH
jgi:DNA-binding beta-propeller fold protein YncE